MLKDTYAGIKTWLADETNMMRVVNVLIFVIGFAILIFIGRAKLLS